MEESKKKAENAKNDAVSEANKKANDAVDSLTGKVLQPNQYVSLGGVPAAGATSSTWQVVDKQNIIDTMTNIFNSDEYINKKQLMALSKSKDVLGEIYDDYSSLDNLFYDDIKDSIVYVSNMLINKQKELDR